MPHAHFRGWCLRAIGTFLIVYVLGWLDVPTMIPYLAAILAVAWDGLRVVRRSREENGG